jgi:hypothetical protein
MIDFKEFQENVHQLRSDMLRMVEEHERDHHGGKACMATRNGIIAFFAHSLGYTAERFFGEGHLIVGMVYEYEANCPGCQELPINE